MRDQILLYINGRRHEVQGDQAFVPLSDYLRYDLGLTGTKVVCAEGDCGACTVLYGRLKDGSLSYKPVNACIQYMYQLDRCHIVTIEGLKPPEGLNAVQEAMVQCHGAQCGYCTPGFVVAMCGFFSGCDVNTRVDEQTIRDELTGNLCRCTGYEPIIKAGLLVDVSQVPDLAELYPPDEMVRAFQQASRESVQIEGRNVDGNTRLFFNPVSVEEAVRFKAAHPETVIVQGGTDLSVVCNKRFIEPSVVMSLSNLPAELEDIRLEQDVMIVGARASLMQLERFVADRVLELHAILETFGGPQIKHAGTLAGNIANGSPIGDTIPFLMVMDAEVELTGVNGVRRVNLNAFYRGYKQLAMQPDELITRIYCPLPKSDETLKLYKISRRKHLDISTFTAAILLRKQGETIAGCKLAYGGVGPTVQRLRETEVFLAGKSFSLATFEEAGKIARSEIKPISDVWGSREYRYQLAENIPVKFFYDTTPTREVVPV